MEISFFLEKYKKFTNSQEKIKTLIGEVFEKNNLKIDKKDIKITDNEIRISVSGVKRVEFVLIKNKLNAQIEKKFKQEGIQVKVLV